MHKSMSLFALVAFVAIQTVACSPWKVVRQSNPNPFNKQTPFATGGAYYRGLKVGELPEDTYKQNLNKAEQDQWESDKTFFSKDFQDTLKQHSSGISMSAQIQPNSYVVKPNVIEIHPGKAGSPLKVKIHVRVEKGDAALDLIELNVEVAEGEGRNFSHRFRKAAQKAGELTAKYLKGRAG